MDIQEVSDELTLFRTVVESCDYVSFESCDDCPQYKTCMKFSNEHLAGVLDSALDILKDVKEKEN